MDESIEGYLWSQLTWRDGAELLAMRVAVSISSIWGPGRTQHPARARPKARPAAVT